MISVKSLARVVIASALLICAEARSACGQQEPLLEDWRWVHYGVESGLPSELGLRLVESADTLWAITVRGIVWFDGYKWIGVAVAGLDSELIDQATPDHRGGIYVTSRGVLYHVDRAGSQVIPVTLDGERVAVTQVASIGPDGFYFTQGGDVIRWEGGRTTVLPALPAGAPDDSTIVLRGIAGALWASLSLESPNPLLEWVDSSWVPPSTPRPRGGPDRVLVEGSTHSVLFAAWSDETSEVWLRNRAGAETRHVVPTPEHPTAATVSPQGDVVVTYGSGLVEVRRGGRWKTLHSIPGGVFRIRAVLFVSNGDLWVVADGGVYLNRAEPRWRLDPELRSLEPTVDAILSATTGDLWLGGANALVVRHADGSVERFESVLGTAIGPVTALAEDREGGIWVGSGRSFDGAFRWFEGRWHRYGAEQGLGAQRVHRIVPDREGRLWFLGMSAVFGDPGPGAFVFDGDGFERLAAAEGLDGGRIYDFAEGPDGALWFATLEGISRLTGDTWTRWTTDDNLLSLRVFTLAIDPDGRLWFGHGDIQRGLGFIDTDDRIRYVASSDVLAPRNVWDLATGPDGLLWVSTRSGLGVVRNGETSFLDRKNGLPNLLLWPVLPGRETVTLGTSGAGIVRLDTSERESPPPVVEISDALTDQSHVVLRWKAFAYMGQQQSEDIPTRYRIDRQEWSSWSTTREIGPISLGDGRHSIEVQAKGLFAALGPTESVAFRIVPPFYSNPVVLGVGAAWLLAMMLWAGALWRRERKTLALLTEREYFHSLIENSSDLITVVDQIGKIQYQSPSVHTVLGYQREEREGGLMFDLLHPDDVHVSQAAMRAAFLEPGSSQTHTVRLRHKDGSWRTLEAKGVSHVDADGHLLGVIHARDVTERESLNAQLQQALKMEAVGNLTGGIAHDFNNLLTVISGNLELARDDMGPEDDGIRTLTDNALDATERATALVQRLLAFSRKQPLSPTATDLNALLERTRALLARTLGATISIRVVAQPELWKCEVDVGQMESAVLNLSINARDAMPEGGVLTIETRNIRLGPDTVPNFPDLEAGPYVRCTIQDDGVGMSPDVLSRIFEPFFTTKEVGRGSGLGMSMVYGFVKQTGGEVMVESVAGEGTSVSLFLPAVASDAVQAEATSAETRPEQVGNGQRILVVEDDAPVRALTVAMLKRLGYATLEAEDGSGALRWLESDERIDLLFTDLVLPGGMSGADIAARAVEKRPGLPVLFVSGYTMGEMIHRGRFDPDIQLLQKPFTKIELADRIGDAIGA